MVGAGMRVVSCGFLLFILVGLGYPACGHASGFDDVKAAVDAARQHCLDPHSTRGGSAYLDEAKHSLVNWVETQLGKLPADGNAEELQGNITRQLDNLGKAPDCFDEYEETHNFANPSVEIRKIGPLLQVITSFDIECGTDDSAYLYEWDGRHWRRIWQIERNIDPKGHYEPQHLETISVLQPPKKGSRDHIVMALGRNEWCTSNWRTVYYSLWRSGLGHSQSLLLDKSEGAFMGEVNGPLAGALDATGAYVEYMVASLDVDVHSRIAVRHYKVQGEEAYQVDPIALSPQNFVEEWLARPWQESSSWSAKRERQNLRRWHDATHNKKREGIAPYTAEFLGQALQCRKQSDLWQVGIQIKLEDQNSTPLYFHVRWRNPYRFRMVSIGKEPWNDCLDANDPNGQNRDLLFWEP